MSDTREQAGAPLDDGSAALSATASLTESKDISQRDGQPLRRSAPLGLAQGAADDRDDLRMELDRDPRPLDVRSASCALAARTELIDERPSRPGHLFDIPLETWR